MLIKEEKRCDSSYTHSKNRCEYNQKKSVRGWKTANLHTDQTVHPFRNSLPHPYPFREASVAGRVGLRTQIAPQRRPMCLRTYLGHGTVALRIT